MGEVRRRLWPPAVGAAGSRRTLPLVLDALIDAVIDGLNHLLRRFDRFNDLFERLVTAVEKALDDR